MRVPGIGRQLRFRFFRPPSVFLEFREIHFIGELAQGVYKCVHAHPLEDRPFLVGNGDHHAIVGALQVTGEVIAGDLVGNLLFTVHATQRGLDERQHVVGHQRPQNPNNAALG